VVYRVMTVCTGNICRSPMAEILLREAFAKAGLSDVVVDSTGISDEEDGNPIDRRARKTLAAHGLPGKPDHAARRITARELAAADLVLPMTAQHERVLRRLAKTPEAAAKIKMYRTFDPAAPQARVGEEYLLDVADPWYGGPAEFEHCFEELVAAVPGIVAYVKDQLG